MSKKTRPLVLIVDDTPGNIRLLATILEPDYEIAIAVNGEQALDMAREALPGLILLDVMLPDIDGYEVCRKLRGTPRTQGIPVIFLTAKSEPADLVEGFKAGGVDYINKPFIREELCARVAAHIRLQSLMNELEEKNQELRRLATTDALTGIPNRRSILDHLEKTLRLANRHDFPVTVLMLDIDNFKNVNDTWGHLAGDEVLAKVADAMRKSIRETDALGRYGGEEFLVCFPHTDLGKARLAAAVAALPWSQENMRVTISGGLAILIPREKIYSLLARADGQLYKAKREGRDRVF